MASEENTRSNCFVLCSRINPIKQRYIVAIMGCLGVVNASIMRQCISPTITQLVVPRNYSDDQIKSKAVCKASRDIHATQANQGTREWSQQLQSFALSSFFIGYLITHIPGGILADKFGSKWVLTLAILSTSIFTLLTPLAIGIGDIYGLITLRILTGLVEGPTYPAISVLMADWVPSRERGFLGTLVMGGGAIGTILANSISGWMLLHYNWHVVFYVWGITGGLWCVFFMILCYSSPLTHPCINKTEKQYLLEEIGVVSAKRKALPATPFKEIFTSIPMWSLIVAQIGHDWAFCIMQIYLPKYMNDVLQIRVDKSGALSSLPSLVMWICSIPSGIMADILITHELMSITKVRKMMTGIAAFGPAIFMVTASYAGCDKLAVVTNFCVGMAFMGTFYAGLKLTPIDMSPNYAGMIMAITNGIGSIISFIAPITVGWLTQHTTLAEWRTVFWLAFAILSITGLIFCIWAESDIQPWNDPENASKTNVRLQKETREMS